MGSASVVVVEETCCQRAGCWEIFEVFQRQKLVSKTAVEAFDITVIPGAAGLDVENFKLQFLEPRADPGCCELRAVVTANVIRKPSGGEQFCQFVDHVITCDASVHVQSQAFASELVNDHQPLQHRAVRRSIKHEVPRPYIVGMVGGVMVAAVRMLA